MYTYRRRRIGERRKEPIVQRCAGLLSNLHDGTPRDRPQLVGSCMLHACAKEGGLLRTGGAD